MEIVKRAIRLMHEGKCIYDQFQLDEDYNVPDAKEDVGNVIEGIVCVKTEEMKLVENYLKISGKAQFKILYMTASLDPQPAVLEGKLPFEEMVYVEQPGEEEYFLKNLRTEFSVSMVHSRKLSLHLLTELEIGRTQMISEEVTEDVESEHAVYKKMKKFRLLGLSDTKKDTYRIKEEITLPGTKESISQILLSEVHGRKLELRPGTDEVTVRGELQVFCLYLSEELKADWVSQVIPYEGKLLCNGLTEGMFYSVEHTLEDTLVDIRMDEDGEMRILGIEGTLLLRMNFYEEQEMELFHGEYAGKDIDVVLTTREFVKMIRAAHISPETLKNRESDRPMQEGTGAGVIFGTTGGVMEAALRSAYFFLKGENAAADAFQAVRAEGFNANHGVQEAEFQIDDITVRTAVVSGLGNTRALMKKIERGEVHYDFVEVMACPGGCVGGGGQPIHDGEERAFERGKRLYQLDADAKIRYSHDNPDIKRLYEEYFGEPNEHKAHMLLHTDHLESMERYGTGYRNYREE